MSPKIRMFVGCARNPTFTEYRVGNKNAQDSVFYPSITHSMRDGRLGLPERDPNRKLIRGAENLNLLGLCHRCCSLV